MDWNIIEGKWKELKGHAREEWGKLTNDELEEIGGKKDRLVGKLQQKYGYASDEANRRADEWAKHQDERSGQDLKFHLKEMKSDEYMAHNSDRGSGGIALWWRRMGIQQTAVVAVFGLVAGLIGKGSLEGTLADESRHFRPAEATRHE